MSLTPVFAADARTQWQELEPAHQETVLDILDGIALNPPAAGEHVADQVREENGQHHYVFVHVLVNLEVKTVTVLGVGHVTRIND